MDTTPNCYVPGEVALPKDVEAQIDRRRSVMGSSYRLSYARPLHFVRGEGVWLIDNHGERYLDFYNNVASLGHCHPSIVAAMSKQAQVLCTNTRYLDDTILTFSERLLALFPDPISSAIFTCTGSEANDLACRIAMSHTGGEGFIVSEHAYHGTTELVAGMSPNLGQGVSLGRNVRTVPLPASERLTCAGSEFEASVRTAISDLNRRGVDVAALLVDTLFSSDGVVPDPPGFLAGAVAAVREAGGIFIADEVQPGFGRTGGSMWGFLRHDLVPDIATLGKPMGNGYPMAGIVARPEVLTEFGRKARYFNTFAGNTVAAATGLAVLEAIENERLLENANIVGGYLRERLGALRHRCLGAVRGAGLFFGVDIVDGSDSRLPAPASAKAIVNGLRARRVLIGSTGKHDNTLKIRPPLIATHEYVDVFIDALQDVLSGTAHGMAVDQASPGSRSA